MLEHRERAHFRVKTIKHDAKDQKGRPENTGAVRVQQVATACQGFSGRPF